MTDIVERLSVAWEKQPGAAMTKINRILIERKDAIAEITRLRQLISEADKSEMEARARLQAMHRRAQIAEGAVRGVMNVIDLWEPTLKFHELSTHDIVMRSIKKDFERAVKKASAMQSEER